MSDAQVRHGDAIDLLGSLPAGSVPLVVTDPPYGISYQSNHRKEGKTAPIAADWNFQIAPFLDAVERALAPNGAAYIFSRWDVYPLWARSLPVGLALKNVIVWDKGNHTAGDLAGNFGFKWEAILFVVKGRHILRGTRWPNVWSFPRVPASEAAHPAEKPVPLLERAILASSNVGDVVVDPFCGSGSAGEAAMRTCRVPLLGDVSLDWVRASRARLGLSLDDLPAAPVFRVQAREPSICLDALDGVHPEDVAALIETLRLTRVA